MQCDELVTASATNGCAQRCVAVMRRQQCRFAFLFFLEFRNNERSLERALVSCGVFFFFFLSFLSSAASLLPPPKTRLLELSSA